MIYLFFAILSVCMIIPLVLVVSISLSDEQSLLLEGYRLIPQHWSIFAYKYVLQGPEIILRAYGVTIFVTVVGSLLSLLLTTATAYAMSRKDYRYARALTFYVFFTMLFSGGLVPTYILITRYLHLKDTIWVLIVPSLLSPFYIMVMRGFLVKIPMEMIESAKIDGAREMRIFLTLVVPLSTPALATIGLFISFVYWNDWIHGLLYIENDKLIPIQLMLYKVMNTIEFYKSHSEYLMGRVDITQLPSLSARMATAILAAGPMMFVFPLFQRYFVQGLTVGSLKG